jgi:hypothetical protein
MSNQRRDKSVPCHYNNLLRVLAKIVVFLENTTITIGTTCSENGQGFLELPLEYNGSALQLSLLAQKTVTYCCNILLNTTEPATKKT